MNELLKEHQTLKWNEEKIKKVLAMDGFFLGEDYQLFVRPWMAIKRGVFPDTDVWRSLITAKEFRESMNATIALSDVKLSNEEEIVFLGVSKTKEIEHLLSNFDSDEHDYLYSSGRLKGSAAPIEVGLKSTGLELCRIEDVVPIRQAYENEPGSDFFIGDILHIVTEDKAENLDKFPVLFYLGKSLVTGTTNKAKWIKTISTMNFRKWDREALWVYKIPNDILNKRIELP